MYNGAITRTAILTILYVCVECRIYDIFLGSVAGPARLISIRSATSQSASQAGKQADADWLGWLAGRLACRLRAWLAGWLVEATVGYSYGLRSASKRFS
jgi:hypothetical protein